ncbi:MAG: type II toxin-antitoxin system VapC family toxin [Nocardioides sp.]
MTLVVDASVLVGAAVDPDVTGRWAREHLEPGDLCAPHLLPVEVANALRRHVRQGSLAAGAGSDMLRDAGLLGIDLYPFEPFGDRIWELRESLTAYDAWYVALAEAHECPLATLDYRLVAADGPHCEFVTMTG